MQFERLFHQGANRGWEEPTVWQNSPPLGFDSCVSGKRFGEDQPDLLWIIRPQAAVPPAKSPSLAAPSCLLCKFHVGYVHTSGLAWQCRWLQINTIKKWERGKYLNREQGFGNHCGKSRSLHPICFGKQVSVSWPLGFHGALAKRRVIRGSGHRWGRRIIVAK